MPTKSPDGTTYGPAVTRKTRTPINFESLPEGQSGGYSAPNPISQFLSLIPFLKDHIGSGSITVDPNSSDNQDLHKTIAHEEVHKLLQPLDFRDKLPGLAESNPAFKLIAQKLQQAQRGGDPVQEVPAYMGSNDLNGVTPVEQKTYVDHLIEQLNKIDPSIANKYRAVAGVK